MSKNAQKDIIFPFNRSGGILVHPTSFPSDYGIGDLGKNAYKFIDFLKDLNLRVWQILPLGPTGYGNSPYQCFSAFAGNPYIISIDKILTDYSEIDIDFDIPKEFNSSKVVYESVISFKMSFFRNLFSNYFEKLGFQNNISYSNFKTNNSYWLNDYSLFMSIKEYYNQKSWLDWDDSYKLRDPQILKKWSIDHANDIEFQKFLQYLFFTQWLSLKTYANKNGISIVGDIPIYVSLDSADVWSNQSLFHLENGNPIVVAGVPPDFFSTTGQLWGNPIYNWKKMKKNKFKWWILRISQTLTLVDIIRLDHFRGFEAYWEVPGNAKTAEHGKWIKAPGDNLFSIMKKNISPLPIIAEDLGVITPEVDQLRIKYSFPGMKILQMAFGDHKFVEKKFLPHNLDKNSVVYTGTHDNEPICAWWENANDATRKITLSYLQSSEEDVISSLIRATWSSVAKLAIIPIQDLLRTGIDSRMNLPGSATNNWEWRFQWDEFNNEYITELKNYTLNYER
jgi:4-alpha-glucanotransferase